MPLITCQNGQIYRLDRLEDEDGERGFLTGLAGVDRLLPRQKLTRAAVHEVLAEPGEAPGVFFALLLARAACQARSQLLVICDPHRQIYPPALVLMGFDPQRLLLLRPKTPVDELWAIAETLRCRGVGAVIAAPPKLTKIQARRLQLAAERGGGVGLLLRENVRTGRVRDSGYGRRSGFSGQGSERFDLNPEPRTPNPSTEPHAAATRWLVQPIPGERTVQRWKIQLVHGHGGRLNQPVVLERCRETHLVRTADPLVHRPPAPAEDRVPA